MSSITRNVYGKSDGTFCVLESSEGLIPPPYIVDLVWLGTFSDLMAALNYHMKQSDLAKVVGVTQQEVSRWVAGSHEPGKPERQAAVVRTYMTHCYLTLEHEHTLEMHRLNVHASRRKTNE